MKLTILIAAAGALSIVSASPLTMVERGDVDIDVNPDVAGAAHACDPCKAAYNHCMNDVCWHPGTNQAAYKYCDKQCSCKAHNAANICVGCGYALTCRGK